MGKKIKEIGELVWKWILFLLLPPITLIITIEFAKVFFSLKETFWGIFIILIGVIGEIIEIFKLKKETEDLFDL